MKFVLIARVLLLSLFTAVPCLAFPRNYNFYFGNIHSHSAYSDGNKDSVATGVDSPADCYAYARQSPHFDFLGISEHNHSGAKMRLENYSKGLQQAKQATANGRFVALYGMEFGVITNGGHVLVYGLDKLVGWEPDNYDIFCDKFDYSHLWEIIGNTPKAFATLAHPKLSDFNKLAKEPYSRSTEKAVCGVAVCTGPAFSMKTDLSDKPAPKFYSYYKKLLALGYMVGPAIDHDNHHTTFGRNTPGRTVVLAQALHPDSITASYRARRFYASQDWNTKVRFTINNAPLRSYIKGTPAADIAVSVSDPDLTDKTKSIRVMYGRPGSRVPAKVLTRATNKESFQFLHTLQLGETFYYYLEVVQQDGDIIFTAPIWVQN